ncbi:histidine kinase dimerization/phosphoacceptor domain -containing protein [uncultured Arcticibacterium sp.]|uniref:tetratricopeptide repeat-containing sensor histidine kinase n=1 Tax=uncultured Arcticibacterium sp. TaxID=2173042 RepID=UPI0030F4E802
MSKKPFLLLNLTSICKTLFSLTLWLLSITPSVAQKSLEEIKIDSILSQPLDSILVWVQENAEKDIEVFEKVVAEGIRRVQKTGDYEKIGDFYTAYGNWHSYHGIYSGDSLIKQTKLALFYYLKTDNKPKIAETRTNLAHDYMSVRRLVEAQNELFRAIAIYEELGDKVGVAKAHRNLSSSYLYTDEPQKAIEYLDKVTSIFREVEDYNTLSYCYLSYIDAYSRIGDYEKANAAAEECLSIVKNKVPGEVFVEVRAYSFKGDISFNQENYQQALLDYQKAFDLCEIQIGRERAATWLTEVGMAYLKLGDYQNALKNLLEGIKAYDKQDVSHLTRPYESIAECYEELGEHKNALLYVKKAKEAKDLVHAEQVANLESEGIIKYETEKKDEALAATEALLNQKNRTQNIILSASGLLTLLLAGLFYSFRKNQKATKVISAKNAENELLLKEIHHRVKNNLELVKSLISLQSAQLEDSATKDAMIASQNRVQSMGIIHQKLYQGTNLGSIEMKDYFLNLGEGILDTFDADEKVKIECAMETMELDVDTAVPLGLIVNELLTNAMKYAFPEKDSGEITISLERKDDKILSLLVKDNGVGKVGGVKPKGTGFGTQLVSLLTQQLNGIMKEENKEGTIISFEFKLDQAA